MRISRALPLLSCACLSTTPVEHPLGPGEIGVGVALEKGELRLPLVLTGDRPLPLSFGETTQVFMWRLRPQDFVHPDGTTVEPELFAGVTVHFQGSDPTPGSCRRCLAPWGTPPQPIFAGDSCDVPRFAEPIVIYRKNGDLRLDVGEEIAPELRDIADELRRDVRIDWPGDCACPEVEVAARPTIGWHYQPSRPASLDHWPFERWAIHPDGTVAGFREQRIAIIPPDATKRGLYPRPAAFPDDLGALVGAVAITIGGNTAFVVAGTSTDPITDFPYYFLVEVIPGEAPRVQRISPVEGAFRPHRLKFVDETHFLMLGGNAQSEFIRFTLGSFYECEVDGTNIACRLGGMHTGTNCSSERQVLADLEKLDQGRFIGGLEKGGVVYGVKQPGANTWTLSCSDDHVFETEGMSTRFADSWTGGIAVFPNGRAFLCASGVNDRALMTADFSEATTLAAMEAMAWDRAAVIPGHFAVPCEDFVSGPGPDEVTLISVSATVAVCSGVTGRCSAAQANDATGAPLPNRLEEQVPGWTLASFFTERLNTDATQLFRRRGREPRELIYGRRVFDQQYSVPLVLAKDDDDPRLITPTSIVRFHLIGETVETSTTVIPGFFFGVFDAALDSTNGSYVVLTAGLYESSGQYGPIILRVWETPPSYEIIERLPPLETPECPIRGITLLYRIVETIPGEFLAFNNCGWLARIAGSEVHEFPVDDWDDPETPEIEARPLGYPFISMSSSHGITWLGANHGSMTRVFRDRAERFSLARTWVGGEYRNTFEVGAHVDAVRALCPDRVLFTSASQQFFTSSPLRAPGDGRYQIDAADFLFHTVEGRTRRSEFNQPPQAILGPSDNYVLLTEGSWSFQYQSPPVRSLITPRAALRDRNGVLWLGGTDRRLVLGLPGR